MSTESREREIGEGITRAATFMRTALSEVQLFLKDVEKQLEKIPLRPQSQSYIVLEDGASNLESPQSWLRTSFGRAYSPGGSKQRSSRLAVVEVHLDPGDDFQEPIAVLGLVNWAAEKTPSELGTAYTSSEWVRLGAPAGIERGKLVEVDPRKREKVFPDAQQVRLAVWELTRFTTPKQVEALVELARKL